LVTGPDIRFTKRERDFKGLAEPIESICCSDQSLTGASRRPFRVFSDVLSARQQLPLCPGSRRIAVSQQTTFRAANGTGLFQIQTSFTAVRSPPSWPVFNTPRGSISKSLWKPPITACTFWTPDTACACLIVLMTPRRAKNALWGPPHCGFRIALWPQRTIGWAILRQKTQGD
jgi:hypothetical protein